MQAPRPTSWTVFGILQLVFAGFAVLGLAFLALSLLAVMPGADDPMSRRLQEPGLWRAWNWFTFVSGLGMLAWQLASGIQLLRGAAGAARLTAWYGGAGIVLGLAGLAMTWFAVFAPMLEGLSDASPGQRAGIIGGLVGGLIGGSLGLVYPVLLVIFFWRDRRTLPAPASPPPETGDPWRAPGA